MAKTVQDEKDNFVDDHRCPECKWDAALRGSRHRENLRLEHPSSGVTESKTSWVEVWICPECGTEFKFWV